MSPEALAPDEVPLHWANITYIVATIAHLFSLWLVLSLALQFHREGKLPKYYRAIITAWAQDFLLNEPVK
eukprot:gene3208-2281_t